MPANENDPLDVKPQIEVSPSPAAAVGGTLLGAALILLAGSSTLVALIKTRNLVQIVNWIKGTEGAAFVSAAIFVGGLVWRVTSSWRKHIRTVIAARAAPDTIAKVLGE